MIGNIFSVSMDYLLKEETNVQITEEIGYYASREFVQGYLMKDKKDAKRIAIGVFLLTCSGLPVLAFPQLEEEMSVVSFIVIALGVGLFMLMAFEEDTYKVIKKEPLVFDHEYLRQVKEQYKNLYKKLKNLIIIGIMMFFLIGIIAIIVDDVLHIPEEKSFVFDALYLLLMALGVFMIVYASCIIDGYEPIVDNDDFQKKQHNYNWVYYVTISIASLVFVVLGMTFGKMAWKIGWILIVITWLITYAVVRGLESRKHKK